MRSYWSWIAASSGLALAGCVTVPAASPRAAQSMPAEIARRYLLPENDALVHFDVQQRWEGFTRRRGSIRSDDGLTIAMEYFEPDASGARAFVVVLPYLEGSYTIPRLLCKTLARHGIASAFLERPAEILAADRSAEEIERMFADTVSRYRALLRWAGMQPNLDANRLGLVGISLGALLGTALMAAEPRLQRGMLLLAGGDLSRVLLLSSEPKVTEYLEARGKRFGLQPEEIAEDFRQHFVSDPLCLAPFVDSRKVLMVSARFDSVMPREFSDKLWEALGRPERILLPTGHGTSGFALPYIESRMIRFFAEKGDRPLFPSPLALQSDE